MSEEVQEETKETEVQPDPNAEVEGRARRMGWRPQEEFRGPKDKWVDASQFVERGETELPVLRERFRALDDKFTRLERENSKLSHKIEDQTTVLKEFRDYSRQGEERAYARAKRELESQMRDATAQADVARFDAARAELDNLERQRPAPAPKEEPKPPPTQVAPEVEEWVRENPWFNNSPEIRQYATAYHGTLLEKRPGLSLRDNLALVSEKVRDKFADELGIEPPKPKANPNREKAATVSTSSAPVSAPAKKGKSYADLPADAKAYCDRFVKEIPKYTREEYVKTYFAGEDE